MGDGRYARFELLSCKPVDAYCRIKKNQNQVSAHFMLFLIPARQFANMSMAA